MLEELESNLVFGISRVISPKSLETRSISHKLLSLCWLEVLIEIDYHDMRCTECYLHPGLSSFNFCTRSISPTCRQQHKALVRKAVSEHCANGKGTTLITEN